MRRVILLLFALAAITARAQSLFEPWRAGSVVTVADVARFGEDNCFAVIFFFLLFERIFYIQQGL